MCKYAIVNTEVKVVMAKKKKVRQGMSTWAKIKQIFWRMIATFAANGLATIDDGKLTIEEINEAFGKLDRTKK